jgi:hypothetical protein
VLHVLLAALVTHADVLISAGHEGRPASCARYPKRACNLGAAGERDWTPIVADDVTSILRAHGVRVVREPADFDGHYAVDAAVFIHFDGSSKPCASGASIGYHLPRYRAAAARWRTLYARYIPFGFEPDDFTDGLRDYYAYKQVDARRASLVLELGELTCPAQRAWLAPRLGEVADILAAYLSALTGKGDVRLESKWLTNAASATYRPR